MGIYAAPPNRQRDPLRPSGVLDCIAVALAIASVVTFALVGGAGVHSDWLAVALTEALLALVVLSASGRIRRSIDSHARTRETNEEIGEAADRQAESRPPGTKPGVNHRQQPRAGQPISVGTGPGRATRAHQLAARLDPRRSPTSSRS
jgi:hypothetical protein